MATVIPASTRCARVGCGHRADTHRFHRSGSGQPAVCEEEGCDCTMFIMPAATTTERVNHPQHYGGDTVYEVWKCLLAWGLQKFANRWNAVKYIARAHKKGAELEDLKKAIWYLTNEVEILEGKHPL